VQLVPLREDLGNARQRPDLRVVDSVEELARRSLRRVCGGCRRGVGLDRRRTQEIGRARLPAALLALRRWLLRSLRQIAGGKSERVDSVVNAQAAAAVRRQNLGR